MSEATPDPLSSLLGVAGVSGSLISRARLSAPFGVASGELPQAVFHTPRTGRCTLRVAGLPPVDLEVGDVVVLPRGAAHDIYDAAASACRPLASFPVLTGSDRLPTVVDGVDPGEPALDLLCGTFRFGEPAQRWLLEPLPEVLAVKGQPKVARFVDATLGLIEAELAVGGAGTRLIADRLVEVLVVYLLRAWAQQTSDRATGWLTGLSDPHVGKVLSAVHAKPGMNWDVERMARTAGLSRTRFVARFRDRVGLPPGEFVTTWKIAVARRALREGAGVAEAADRVGYASEASFSRAFKRVVGMSPGAWRAAR